MFKVGDIVKIREPNASYNPTYVKNKHIIIEAGPTIVKVTTLKPSQWAGETRKFYTAELELVTRKDSKVKKLIKEMVKKNG